MPGSAPCPPNRRCPEMSLRVGALRFGHPTSLTGVGEPSPRASIFLSTRRGRFPPPLAGQG